MAIEVHIPTVLRPLAEGNRTVAGSGGTIDELIDVLESRFPGMGKRLRIDGEVPRYMNIYVNDADIRFDRALSTPLRDGDVVSILPAVAGG
ncbi:putative thiamineS [Pilimelia anulata]|uniref:Putative thiamineS n=1 Tax=Pilimelia anulata TaxID=53371 RepID=A0A8J3B0Z4_9ACTN|nr:MoaD/ThiS family protein [Pilimelia anulata]GGJ83101.1 putative thiamineS [Pilimelia anulata]